MTVMKVAVTQKSIMTKMMIALKRSAVKITLLVMIHHGLLVSSQGSKLLDQEAKDDSDNDATDDIENSTVVGRSNMKLFSDLSPSPQREVDLSDENSSRHSNSSMIDPPDEASLQHLPSTVSEMLMRQVKTATCDIGNSHHFFREHDSAALDTSGVDLCGSFRG